MICSGEHTHFEAMVRRDATRAAIERWGMSLDVHAWTRVMRLVAEAYAHKMARLSTSVVPALRRLAEKWEEGQGG